MAILVIGATGFIGAPLVRALLAGGDEVVAVSRRGDGAGGAACDRRDVAALVALAVSRRVRTVIDLLAYTEAETLPLLEAFGGRVERYVLASSMDVYRNYEGLHGKSRSPPVREAMDEHAPLRVTPHPYRSDPLRPAASSEAWLDDYDKIPLEEALRRADLRHTILRLPMVYGRGDRQQRFRWAISPMLKAVPTLTIDPGWAAWRTTYGFVDDLADALAACGRRPSAPSGTFNLGEPDPPDHRAWAERFARTLDWPGMVELRPAPPESPIASLDLDYPLIADTRAFRQAYGWTEPTPLAKRLEGAVAEQRRRDFP